jgi:hypothetical protein
LIGETFNMITRRQFVQSAVAALGVPLLLPACASDASDETYIAAVRRIWHPVENLIGDSLWVRRELVRYAILAPSSHNTQCWRFRVEESQITLTPDLSRRCPAVDPDDHHLFVSLGCATENLIQAALANGLHGVASVSAASTATAAHSIAVALTPTKAALSPLFQAISERQCTRAEFDGKPVSTSELKTLEVAGTGAGVRVLLFTERPALESILELVVAGNSAQMNDPAFVAELKKWIRFNSTDAVTSGDGLYSGTTGNPSIPGWLGNLLFILFYSTQKENDKYAKQVRSSAGIAVFVSDTNDPVHWIEAGRCYERFALQATALGIQNAFVNQPVEVATVRPALAAHLGIANARPDLVVRFGRGTKMPQSLRRPLDAVIA